ncbi:hypothetical protein Aperf_G00000041693 [Anoplocephala perfoliata]
MEFFDKKVKLRRLAAPKLSVDRHYTRALLPRGFTVSARIRDKKMGSKNHIEGKEMIRIQGCYMYMINKSGAVGALLGYRTLTIVVPECTNDEHLSHTFLRLSSWLYPLDRSFSPVYCWGPDRIILPEPFSRVDYPDYIIIRLPYGCSDFQKSTLWNILDMYAHVRGKFSSVPIKNEGFENSEMKFFLTEMSPFDDYDLHVAEPNENAPDIKVLRPVKFPQLGYKGKRFVGYPARLAVALHTTKKIGASSETKQAVTARKCCYQPNMCNRMGYNIVTRSYAKPAIINTESGSKIKEVTLGGVSHNWITLPDHSGNILRQYILGPRDWQHIKVITTPKTVTINYTLLFAIKKILQELARQRNEKESLGIPPSFDEKKNRLLFGFGETKSLNAFGPNAPTKLIRGYASTQNQDRLMEKSRVIQNLESAAEYFDNMLEKKKLMLLCLEPDEDRVDRMDRCDLVGPLIPRPITFRYDCCEMRYGILMTLSACEEQLDYVSDAYPRTTNYLERRLEECDHHYPKIRPINPYLDPVYTYSRYAPIYSIPGVRTAE